MQGLSQGMKQMHSSIELKPTKTFLKSVMAAKAIFKR
jgi:hypothetical protein